MYIDENLKEYEQRQKLLELTVKSNANTLLKRIAVIVPIRSLIRLPIDIPLATAV